MSRIRTLLVLCAGGLMIGAPPARAQGGGMGLRVGAGTDISLGIAGGVELNYARMMGAGAVELGLMVFGGRFTEDSEEGCCSYHERTDLIVGAAVANYLFAYNAPGPYFVAGVGVGAISMSWREESPDDTSLGPSLPGGGSYDEDDGAVAGTIVNFGIGARLTRTVDLRAQVPTFFLISDAPGGSSVVPTFTVSLGFRF